MKFILLICVVCYSLLGVGSLQANTIGFDEEFSLAADRGVPLKQLIPGTEDYYYYYCLYHQYRKDYEQVEKLLKQWLDRNGRTQRYREMLNRHEILKFPDNDRAAFEHITRELQLNFNHTKKQETGKQTYPSNLDSSLFSFVALKAAAINDYRDLSGFEPAGIDALISENFDPNRRRDLLNRMVRPDGANLAAMVVEDLQYKHSGGFGSLKIHQNLLLSQLDYIAKKIPDLLNETNFVLAYLTKLQPGEDESWESDPHKKMEFLQRLYQYVKPLNPAFNSLKAHLLYHILDLSRTQGLYDSGLFIEYLKYPRSTGYVSTRLLANLDSRHRVDLRANYAPSTRLPAINNDEALVRDYLQKILVDAKDASAFSPYIESEYLKRLLAETKLLNGVGDLEKWFSLLNAHEVKDLKDRIELELLANNKVVIKADDPIELNVRIKNVKKLIIKIYKLNLVNYYRENLSEVSTAIDLDGLVANHERIVEYDLPDHRRHDEKFSFPDLKDAGVYVIELIGNGMSSRALIRRGQLSFVQQPGAAGQLFTVFNENREQVKDAVILLNNQQYTADNSGLINVPYSSSPGQRKIIIAQGNFASLHSFSHEAEQYSFNGSFHVDREALVAGKNATLIFRPALFANSFPVDVNLLQEVVLQITSTDLDGVESNKEVAGFKLFNEQVSTYTFKVPEKLSSLRLSIKGKIENLSMGRKDELNVQRSFALNGIEKTEKTNAFYVRKDRDQHIVELLGKSGEPGAAVPVNLVLKPALTKRSLNVTMQTDANGRLHLGRLDGIDSVTLGGPEGLNSSFSPSVDKNTLATLICAQQGDAVMIPINGVTDRKIEDLCSLFEVKSATYVSDCRSKVTLADSCLKMAGLAPGDYELYLKQNQTAIQIKIADGKRIGNYTISAKRALPINAAAPMQIADVKTVANGKKIQIRLVNAKASARVHVFAGRFLPEFELFNEFASIEAPMLPMIGFSQPMSLYLSGRNIGDEYRYILERKYAKIFPGNMLRRPSLLLNPWSLRKTDTQTRDAEGGGAWAGEPSSETQSTSPRRSRSQRGDRAAANSGFVTLDFLNEPSILLANLIPDKSGVVEIDLEQLSPRQSLQIIAVDLFDVALRETALSEVPEKHQDLRMSRALDAEKDFSQQKNISVLIADKTLIIEDIATAKMEAYDSVASVYRLFATINPDAKFAEFSFITSWPDLVEAKKLELYSKYACHELNFFLYQRDRGFFAKVVKPYIAHKRDKTFMDKWLLGNDLAEYLDAWAFSRLNIVEKILLGQRLPAMAGSVDRHVNDLLDLLPDDRERFNHLFKMALSGNVLETSDALGYDAAKSAAISKGRAVDKEELAVFGRSSSATFPAAAPAMTMKSKRANMLMDEAVAYEADEKGADDSMFMASSGAIASLELDSGRRQSVRQLFRQVDKTEEWVENNYYQVPIEQQVADLIKVNAFWKDYAAHQEGKPFVSPAIAEATGNLSEMMLALAVIDLPFKAQQHQSQFAGAKMTLQAAGNVIVFHEEIRPANAVGQTASILTGQNFFAHSDRYSYEKNERFDKFVSEEFQTRVVYGCQVVLTNPTSSRQKVDVLMQIPAGALPVLQSHYTRSVHLQLEAFSTKTAEYYFYFPFAGNFKHYPVHVSEGATMLSAAKPFVFKVVDELTNFDKTSWPYISQHGSAQEVFDYLQKNNIERLDLELIAYRLKNQDFFLRCYELLKGRQNYNNTVWSYGIMHRHPAAVREFVEHSSLAANVGSTFVSDLLTVNPVARHNYQHKEYWPLVNARVYPLGKKREILNDQLAAQYTALLADLRYREQLSDYDRMAVVYYLLVQDRLEEAGNFLTQIGNRAVVESIQYKYLKAYLAFSNGKTAEAVGLAEPYKDYPVIRWRNMFADVLAQADEIAGKAVGVSDQDDREQKQRLLASTQPDIDVAVDNRVVTLRYRNLDQVRVNFYLMDIELMFSRQPFVQEVSGQFSIISPNHSMALNLDKAATEMKLDLPEKFRDSNVMIEVTAAGLNRTAAYYPHSLAVSLIESYGQLHINHQKTAAPLSKVYVKVYARNKGGEVVFYKDGYTDLRGKFDYASLSTSQLDNVERFAILIMSDDCGSVIRETAPPSR